MEAHQGSQPVDEPPKVGLEYILARIGFEFLARGSPGIAVTN